MESPQKLMATASASACTARRDRLSPLPPNILHHVYSFLGPNDVARLCLVSTKFRRLSLSTPYLYFSADFHSTAHLLSTRSGGFCNYVIELMKRRERLGVGLTRFVIHWFCNLSECHVCDAGDVIVNSWINAAARANVEELDILVHLGRWRSYSLPDCVYSCPSLKVLRLNTQNGRLNPLSASLDKVEQLFLDSVLMNDRVFSNNISRSWKSLKMLHIERVPGLVDLNISSTTSLQELKISNCHIGKPFIDWDLRISGESFKVLILSNCQLAAPCKISLSCPSLESFRVHSSKFNKRSIFGVSTQTWLQNFELCGSDFLALCYLEIGSQAAKHVKLSNCRFREECHVDTTCLSIQDFTISDCELLPLKRSANDLACTRRHMSLEAQRLVSLGIDTSDRYTREFPLVISAPKLKIIQWMGHPLDFCLMERLSSLVNADIGLKPPCRHKTQQLEQRCRELKSHIYCSAALLESLSEATCLTMNIWPIEIYFMRNNRPIQFPNLRSLFLMVDGSLPEQVPVIASFLQGMPNLKALAVQCQHKSPLLGDPKLIDLLGLNAEKIEYTVSPDSKEVQITLVESDVDC